MKICPSFFSVSLLAAALLQACNSPTPVADTEENSAKQVELSRTILAKLTALQYDSYSNMPSGSRTTEITDPGSSITEITDQLEQSGVCQGYIDFFQEVIALSDNPTDNPQSVSPNTRRILECLTGVPLENMTDQDLERLEASLPSKAKIDACVCGSGGTVFSQPTEAAKASFRSPGAIAGRDYKAAPTIGGNGYQAPVSAAEHTYRSPSSVCGKGYRDPSQ